MKSGFDYELVGIGCQISASNHVHIMCMSQCQELDLHKGTLIQSDGQKHTLNSLPKTLGFARKSGYHLFNLPSHVIVCTIQACLDPSGV